MSYRMESWKDDKVHIAGATINKGDVIEIGLGRQRIVAEVLGWDRVLYCFHLRDTQTNEEMFIPYKSIKYIKITNKKQQQSSDQPKT